MVAQISRNTRSGAEPVAGAETKLFTTLNADAHYTDVNPPSSQHLYYYVKAINSVGTETQSNEIDLVAVIPPLPESACVTPRLTKLTDPAGDTSLVLGLATTPAPPGSGPIVVPTGSAIPKRQYPETRFYD